MDYSFPPPKDWQAFERLCCDLWKKEWDDPHAKLHGRPGQADHGVDVYGQTVEGWVAVQCKRKDIGLQLTEAIIRHEVEQAKKFAHPLIALTLATTARRDTAVQEIEREVDAEAPFRVSVASWNDIEDLLNKYPDVARQHYAKLLFPTATPHLLPFPPLGPLFLGRDARLQALARGNDPTAIVQHDTIHGLGGIGKTRLAVEFAWRYGDQYPGGVFFVSAESPETLDAGLVALAVRSVLNLPENESRDVRLIAEAVLSWFQDHERWLLILDNVDSKEASTAVKALLPRLSKGRVLITSRRSLWPKGIRKQALGVLDPDDAHRYLLTATEERTPAEDDEERAGALAERLGYLPLALEQAAAYIERHRLSFEGYERLWQVEREKVLTWHDESSSYPRAVAVTWQRTFDALSPGAQTILRIASLLAPEPIPERVFTDCGDALTAAHQSTLDELDHKDKPLDPRATLAELADYSMVGWRDGTLTVHRMVQEVVRSRLPDRRQWVEWTLGVVDAVAVGDVQDVRTWPVWDPLRPHVAMVAERGDAEGISEPTSRLMNELALLLKTKGLYEVAEPFYRRALEIDEQALGEEHPKVAICLNNLATLLQATNRMVEAEPLVRRALKIGEQAFGEEHPKVAIRLNNLAQLLKDTNRMVEAEPLMRRALKIDEKAFGEEHPDVAIDLNNLAQLLKDTNRMVEAEPLMRRALKIDEKAFGEEHPNVAIRLGNLAGIELEKGQLNEAETLVRRAIEIFETSLGPEHPHTLTSHSILAEVLAAKADDT